MKDTPYGGGASRRLLAALGIVAVVVIAFLLGRVSSDDPAPQRPEAETAPDHGPGPMQELNGVPVGYARTEDGAAAAAFEFSRVMAGGSSDVATYSSAMDTLAAPEWRNRARELAESSAEFVRTQYGPSGAISFYPLRYKIENFSSESATVELWGVALASRGKDSRIDESWLIGVVQLTWVDGDWRVSGQRSEPGPTPQLLQDQEGPAVDRIDGFREYEVVFRP